MKYLYVSILALALLLAFGCTKNPPTGPNEEEQPLTGSLSFYYRTPDGSIQSLDESEYELYSSFTDPDFVWQELDTAGYQVMAYRWLLLCVADTGLNGEFIDSLYIAIGDPSNLRLLTGRISDGFNGNYYKFRIHPDLYLENEPAASHNYLLKAYHGSSSLDDYYSGSFTNWSERSVPWPVSGNTNHIFHVYENGEDQVDSLVYAVSYTLAGVPIDTIRVEMMVEFPEGSHHWHFTIYVREDGHLEVGQGEPIWIWIGP